MVPIILGVEVGGGVEGVANLGTLYNLFISNVSLHSSLYILNNFVYLIVCRINFLAGLL